MILDEIGAYLQAQQVGTVGTDIFLGRMPDKPDKCMALYEYGGSPSRHVLKTSAGAVLERPRVQVSARDADYLSARTRAESAWKKLDGLTNATLSGVRYLVVAALQSPFSIGPDENQRPVLAFNIEALKELS